MDGVPGCESGGWCDHLCCMLVRGFVPWLVMVMVNVAVLPTFRVFWLAVLVISGFCFIFMICFTVCMSMVCCYICGAGIVVVFRVVVAIPLIIYALLMVPSVEVKLTNPV